MLLTIWQLPVFLTGVRILFIVSRQFNQLIIYSQQQKRGGPLTDKKRSMFLPRDLQGQ